MGPSAKRPGERRQRSGQEGRCPFRGDLFPEHLIWGHGDATPAQHPCPMPDPTMGSQEQTATGSSGQGSQGLGEVHWGKDHELGPWGGVAGQTPRWKQPELRRWVSSQGGALRRAWKGTAEVGGEGWRPAAQGYEGGRGGAWLQDAWAEDAGAGGGPRSPARAEGARLDEISDDFRRTMASSILKWVVSQQSRSRNRSKGRRAQTSDREANSTKGLCSLPGSPHWGQQGRAGGLRLGWAPPVSSHGEDGREGHLCV